MHMAPEAAASALEFPPDLPAVVYKTMQLHQWFLGEHRGRQKVPRKANRYTGSTASGSTSVRLGGTRRPAVPGALAADAGEGTTA